ncbi:hypothetical protein EBESD8_48130 [Rhodococcus aetherivorans]|nr:hypothetical protein EBESD8_48130 [Rhodococcus aetherivorans]
MIVPGPQSMYLSDRVLSATPRAETVTDRLEIRLEDRLQHQQQRRLNHAIHRRGNTEPPEFAAPRLRNHSFPNRKRNKGPRLQLVSNLTQECDRLGVPGDGRRCQPVDTGRTCALVAPHPFPRDGEKIRVVDEVVHIIKEAVGIVDRPVVQLALHLSYPPCRPIGIGPCQLTGIHQCLRSCRTRCINSAGALRHVRGFPSPGLLRPLRPTTWPSTDDASTRPATPG